MLRVVVAATVSLTGVLGSEAGVAQRSGSNAAVQKVIQMLTDMEAKGKKEKNAEEVAFAKFQTWCSQESSNLKTDIGKNAEAIEVHTASIGKLGSDMARLGDEIDGHQQDKASHDADAKANKAQRAKDHADFLDQQTDFSGSVDALDRALRILSKQDYDRPAAAAALLQVRASANLPEHAQSIVAAFLSMLHGSGKDSPMGGTDYKAPEANAYEFQSGGIVEVLKRLQDEFRGKLTDAQKEEMNSKHASDMIQADLADASENSQKASDEKTVEKSRKAELKAGHEKQLASTSAVKAESEKVLKEMTTECTEKQLSYEEKQKLRGEELEAIAKAVEILSSSEVSGSAEKYLALSQSGTQSAFVQLFGASSDRTAALRGQGIHRRIREFLSSEGRRLHSQRLSLLASKLVADPFSKVKKMIDAMITRLMDEANQDAQHEGFCDTEMGKSKVTRNKLTEDIDSLTAACESGKATISELAEGTATLSKEVEELVKAMGEATDLRTKEKATNEETVKDAKAAQAAVAAATAVLKDFYAKAGTATALLQEKTARAPSPSQWGLKMGVKMGSAEWNSLGDPQTEGTVDTGHKEEMQTFGETETGQQDEAQYGVLGLLEVIQSDFATLEADTKAAEAAAAEAYERFMVESNRSKATKDKKIELNTADKVAAEAKLTQDTADLKSTQDALLAAERYYDKLVPQCIDQGMTWDERVAARQAEINSLKEALKILQSEDVA